MTGAAVLDRLTEAGAAVSLDRDGRVRIVGASRLAPDLLDLARRHRAELAATVGRRRLADFYLATMRDCLAALAAPDSDLAAEHDVTAQRHDPAPIGEAVR